MKKKEIRKMLYLLLAASMIAGSGIIANAGPDDDYIPDGWHIENGEKYWYEHGVKQGTEGRGKEIYDPESNAWYWLDAVSGGKVAKAKEVYMDSNAGPYADQSDGTGKWVRYDADGHMIKGWYETSKGKYYYDVQTGAMAKGIVVLDDTAHEFDTVTGLWKSSFPVDANFNRDGWNVIDGESYWFESGVKQGVFGRGKEIYDPGSDAWYWLDSIDGGKVAKNKDVYQESQSDRFGTQGKWVRYDENGHMIKGWNDKDGMRYYFDPVYGTMAKGVVSIGGHVFKFDDTTGGLSPVPATKPNYPLLKDANGNVYDLGGMEIIVRDWWSDGTTPEPTNEYERDRQEYLDWAQLTYNFSIKELAISDWGDAPADFVDYTVKGGDGNNFVFTLRDNQAITSAMRNGLMYNLSSLNCLDFTKTKFTQNKVHEKYNFRGNVYAMAAGIAEPRTGVYFNKRLLLEVGIDPDSIYDLQANNQWTWSKWQELMGRVQRDIDGDGVIDIYGTTQNAGMLVNIAVFSNGGEYVGNNGNQYTYALENPATVEGLEFAESIMSHYSIPMGEDDMWDFYKQAFIDGKAAFLVEDAYAGTNFNWLKEDGEDDYGFVCFPMGPQATDYTNEWNDNPAVIPACYDAERAWKIAFAWNVYTDETPGYEANSNWKSNYRNGLFDNRSIDETLTRMISNGRVTYHNLIPNLELGPDLVWGIYAGCDVQGSINAIRDTWKRYIDDANN